MTPRRPSPARPGTRPGSRTGGRAAARTAVRPRSGERTTTNTTKEPAATAPGPASPSDPESAAAYQQTVLRVGGPEGVAVPARVLILAVVLLGAFVVTFPSLRGYLSQQAQYDAVVDRIKEASDTSTTLENELAQWKDETYVRSQVRERLGYVMPGDTSYVVVGADSMKENEAGGGATPGSPDAPWYEELRDSSRAAGQANSTAPAGSKGGTDGKTLNPAQKELPTGEPNQAPSDPPKTTPKPAVTPQTKETP